MNKIKFTQDEEGYLYNECYYDNLTDLLAIGVCNFCGCGRPDEALIYIMNSLKYIEKAFHDDYEYEEWKEEGELLFPTIGSNYFIYYWLSEMGFTEHGGSVPGWVTDKGFEFVKLVEQLKNEKED